MPTAVVIAEAVELAKRYSTDDSGRFVNGMLSAIAAEVRPTPEDSGAGSSDLGRDPGAGASERSCPRWRACGARSRT